MHCDKYPHLFQPMTIRGVTFKNRVLASPITTNRIVRDGVPTPEAIDVYETKARGGFAEVTVTESFIDHEYSWRHEHGLNVWENPMTTYHMESIMTLTEAIRAHGAVASIQLNHVGAMNHPDTIPGHKNPIGPSAFVREDGVQVEEMSVAQMEETARRWAEAAWTCKSLGFQMVNLHGGHGWLLNQFISPRFNHRLDEFGGSMENRARFPIMVCQKIREACGDDFLIEYRMSGSERIEGGMTLEDGIAFARLIQDHVDLIHVTSGVYSAHVETKAFSSMFDKHGCNLDLAEAIKKAVHVPVVSVGGFNAPEQIEEAIASGKCDFVALGRQQFADPDFVKKTMQGRENEIAPCLRCSCFNPLAPDPNKRPIPELWHCAVNPRGQRELRWRNAPRPAGKRRVMVVGGGPAGLYAAATAAERGHDVILVEACRQLGGLLWFTDVDAHKESLRRFRDSLIARCTRLGVKFQLGTAADRNYIQQMQPDAVICAIGSSPVRPPIAGIETAHHALYCYDRPAEVGHRVVMIGGGLVGCETGYWLADTGHEVHVLEMREDLAMDANDSHRRALLPRMERSMTWDCSARVTEVADGGVKFRDKDGAERFVEADTVLYAVGQRANTQMVDELRGACDWFVPVGDCVRARQVKQAVYEGFCAAMDIL